MKPLNDRDWDMLHYAVGLLLGIASKHDVIDVTIYHNSIRVRVEHVKKEKDDEDRGR